MRSPKEYSYAIQNKVRDAILEKHSNIQGKRQTVEIKDVFFDPLPDPDDYSRHRELLNKRQSEGVNMYGHVILKNNHGHIIEEREKVKLGFVPSVTNRHSFLINGKEYIVHNQLRLRPAVYTKIDRLGQPIADFNLSKGSNMSLMYDQKKQQLLVKIAGSFVPLYTILKDVYHVPDATLVQKLGSSIHVQEMTAYQKNPQKHLLKLHQNVFRNAAAGSTEEVSSKLHDYFDATRMDGNTNLKTMGKAYTSVDAEVLLQAAVDVLKIYKGQKDPTWKDNLAFKAVYSTEEFLHERLAKGQPVSEMHMKLKPRIDKAEKIAQVGLGQTINSRISKFFTESDLVNYPQQVNPMEFLENAHKITSMGEGGVTDTNSLPMEARNLHSSHLGFIDPIRTPDNLRAGIDLRLGLNAKKVGDTLVTRMYKADGTVVNMPHTDLYFHIYTTSTEPVMPNGLIRAYYKGKMIEVPKKKVEYFLTPSSIFTVSTASLPFTKNTFGQRNAMGAKMTTQALSLVHRELPVVDTKANQATNSYYTPKAPVDGTVVNVTKEQIDIKGSDGKVHVVKIPNNFALNYHSYIHVDPWVKVGDRVKAGQLLGENNFTKDGKLALGVNAKVAFMPYRGLNFEDGFAVTETGAKKFTSNHIFQETLELTDSSTEQDQKKYVAYFPNRFNVTQLGYLDNGVIKVGTKVHSGDPLILAIKKKNQSPEMLRMGKMAAKLSNPYKDVALTWTKDYPGEILEVVKGGTFIKVVIKAVAPLIEADKIASRYGSKGIVSKIIPDKEAPHYKDGTVPDILINPAAVPSRMNIGQIHEAQMAKALQKLGKTVEYDNLNNRDTFKEVKHLMKLAKTKDTEDLYDPVTKKTIKNVFTGTQYFLKLAKQAETNYAARAGGDYDIDMRPVKGGEEGAKSIGTLDFYALVSHDSRHLLKEKATHTSEYNPDFWASILSGRQPPPPKPTFTYEKNMAMLRGAGINVKKEGNYLKAVPMTDKEILGMSRGEIKSSKMVTDKVDPITGLNYRPEKGGLFDPAKTGGLTGTDYTHIKLNTPILNALYEKPTRALLDLTGPKLQAILDHEDTITVKGEKYTGAEGIQKALSVIPVKESIANLTQKISTEKNLLKKDGYIKKLKYLKALEANKLTPDTAYINTVVPVIPPKYRPIYPKETGEIVTSDANHLYKDIIEINNMLESPMIQALGKESSQYKQRVVELNQAIKKMQGLTAKDPHADKREPVGFIDVIKGRGQPKYGYFQNKVMTKSQDVVARGTIAPDPRLGIDECKIPEPMAWTLYGSLVIGEMVKHGYTYPKAAEEVASNSMTAKNILIAEMRRRPVILNRAPSLHKFNILAFFPQIASGKNIYICPLVVKGFNADFDGDAMTVHIPMTEEGLRDALRMLPSKNLFNPRDSSVMHAPDQEAVMGLYLITHPKQARPIKKFTTQAEALAAFHKGLIEVNDNIDIINI